MDWDDLRHFLALAENGTLLAAARKLGVEHATISRRVAALELALNRKLVDRRGRKVVLTADGEQLVQLASIMAAQAATIEQMGRNSSTDLKGEVRISAPPTLSSLLFAAPLVRLRKTHPGIAITMIGERRFASLNRREADIAIRLSRPEEGDYRISRLGEIDFAFYASPAYLSSVAEEDWTFIGYDDVMNASPQQILLREVAAHRPIAVKSSMLEFQIAAAEAGGGIVLLPDFALSGAVDLVPVNIEPHLQREVWLVVHQQIADLPVVRAVVNELKCLFTDRRQR